MKTFYSLFIGYGLATSNTVNPIMAHIILSSSMSDKEVGICYMDRKCQIKVLARDPSSNVVNPAIHHVNIFSLNFSKKKKKKKKTPQNRQGLAIWRFWFQLMIQGHMVVERMWCSISKGGTLQKVCMSHFINVKIID